MCFTWERITVTSSTHCNHVFSYVRDLKFRKLLRPIHTKLSAMIPIFLAAKFT